MASNHPHTATSILDKFYAAEREFAAGKTDGSEMLQSLSEDFKGYQSEDLPYGGVYEGKLCCLCCPWSARDAEARLFMTDRARGLQKDVHDDGRAF